MPQALACGSRLEPALGRSVEHRHVRTGWRGEPDGGYDTRAIPGTRVVNTDAFGSDWMTQGPFMACFFEFEGEGGKTRYTVRARHWTEVAKSQHQAMGFTDGWSKVAQQFVELTEADARAG